MKFFRTPNARRFALAFSGAAVAVGLAMPSAIAQPLNPYVRGPVLSVNDLRGNVTAAGVGLRGTGGTGTITISGIPAGSFVKEAILYWTILDASPMSAGAPNLTFVATPIVGTLIGNTATPCQPMAAAYTFRADVTPYVSGNGGFVITGALDSGNVGASPVAEGASLVVIYSNISGINQDILVYEGAALVNTPGATATTNMAFFDATSPVTASSIAFIVADGESATSDDTLINTFSLGMDKFDGSDPPGSVQFWDTDTYILAAFLPGGSTSLSAQVKDVTDCLLWVASPFAVGSPIPNIDVITENQTPNVPVGSTFNMRVTVSNNTSSNIRVTALIDVYRQNGVNLGTLVMGRGTVPALTTLQRQVRRRMPNSAPGQVRNVPLYVYTTLSDATSGQLIDDDYCIFYLR